MVKNLSNNRSNISVRNTFDISTAEAVEKLMRMARAEDLSSIDPLIEVLSGNKFKDKHKRIIEIFGNLREEKIIDFLISLLGHSDEVIRRYSAMSLGRLKSKKAVMPLARLLKDPSIPLKKTLLEAIYKVTASQEIHFLSHFLTKPQEDYQHNFTLNRSYYFDSVEELIINLLEGKEFLRSYVHLAILYEAEFRYVQAEDYIKKILAVRKDDIDIQILYIKVLKGLEKYSEVLNILNKILTVKNTIDYSILYADILIKLKKYKEAISLYDDIYLEKQDDEIEEKLMDAHYHYGMLLEDKGSTEEAMKYYEKACLINPSHREIDFFQSHLLFKSNKIGESIKLLNKYMLENTAGKWYDDAIELKKLLNEAPDQKGLVTWVKGFLG